MNNLSVVIPWRDGGDEWRNRSFDWICSRYQELMPETELIISDTGEEEFNRSKFINAGVSQASTEYVLIGDADTIPFPRFIQHGLSLLEDKLAPWVIPYGDADYYNADQRSSEWILDHVDPADEIHPSQITWEHKIMSWSGQVLIRRSDFLSIGGFDERFRGWGYEDNAFVSTADTLLGWHKRVQEGYVVHIWHPVHLATTWDQPHINMNRSMYEQYRSVENNRAAMKALVETR